MLHQTEKSYSTTDLDYYRRRKTGSTWTKLVMLIYPVILMVSFFHCRFHGLRPLFIMPYSSFQWITSKPSLMSTYFISIWFSIFILQIVLIITFLHTALILLWLYRLIMQHLLYYSISFASIHCNFCSRPS